MRDERLAPFADCDIGVGAGRELPTVWQLAPGERGAPVRAGQGALVRSSRTAVEPSERAVLFFCAGYSAAGSHSGRKSSLLRWSLSLLHGSGHRLAPFRSPSPNRDCRRLIAGGTATPVHLHGRQPDAAGAPNRRRRSKSVGHRVANRLGRRAAVGRLGETRKGTTRAADRAGRSLAHSLGLSAASRDV